MYKTNKPPVKTGQEYNVEIIAIGEKGDPLTKIEGYAIFVKGELSIGDKANIRITKTLPKIGFAEVLND